jgi:hypothetical protein
MQWSKEEINNKHRATTTQNTKLCLLLSFYCLSSSIYVFKNIKKEGKITEGIYTSRLNNSKSLSKKDVIYNVLNLTIQYTQYEI